MITLLDSMVENYIDLCKNIAVKEDRIAKANDVLFEEFTKEQLKFLVKRQDELFDSIIAELSVAKAGR